MSTTILDPCRKCLADCRVEQFEGPHIEGKATLWVCSNHQYFGGDCPNELAYLTVEAWNGATVSSLDLPTQLLIERLFEATKHGDGDHRRWLKDAFTAFFSGQPVPALYGKGNKERKIDELMQAIKPFADFGFHFVNQHGWNAVGQSVLKERVVDWFGPQDFYLAWKAEGKSDMRTDDSTAAPEQPKSADTEQPKAKPEPRIDDLVSDIEGTFAVIGSLLLAAGLGFVSALVAKQHQKGNEDD